MLQLFACKAWTEGSIRFSETILRPPQPHCGAVNVTSYTTDGLELSCPNHPGTTSLTRRQIEPQP